MQKGIAIEVGIDEGTIKEKKMRKFEEFKKRKMQEELQRRQDRDKI